jgi:hypothetical protein
MKFRYLLLLFVILFSIGFCFSRDTVLAYDFNKDSGLNKTAAETGHLTGGIKATDEKGFAGVIGKYLGIVLSFVGILFLMLMIYGGYMWMTAAGNDQQVEKSKTIIINAVIGLAVVVSAYGITNFVFDNLLMNSNPAESGESGEPLD